MGVPPEAATRSHILMMPHKITIFYNCVLDIKNTLA